MKNFYVILRRSGTHKLIELESGSIQQAIKTVFEEHDLSDCNKLIAGEIAGDFSAYRQALHEGIPDE